MGMVNGNARESANECPSPQWTATIEQSREQVLTGNILLCEEECGCAPLCVVDGEVGNVRMFTGPMMRELRFNSTPGQAGILPQVASRPEPFLYDPCRFSRVRTAAARSLLELPDLQYVVQSFISTLHAIP